MQIKLRNVNAKCFHLHNELRFTNSVEASLSIVNDERFDGTGVQQWSSKTFFYFLQRHKDRQMLWWFKIWTKKTKRCTENKYLVPYTIKPCLYRTIKWTNSIFLFPFFAFFSFFACSFLIPIMLFHCVVSLFMFAL